MISLDLDAMVAAAHRLLAAHGLTVDGAGDNDRIISPAITSARDVLALAAALRTERAAREAAHAHHAAIAGAVRAEREAVVALAAQHAADVAAASRSTREACAAQLRARAECLRRYAYEATVTADAAEYAHDAREVDACAAIVASVALAAPTGGGE